MKSFDTILSMNDSRKEIITLLVALVVIMLASTLLVLGFNSIVGFSTDVGNDDVLTAISVVSFLVAVILKYVYNK
jgi:hypothetical protein